MRGGGQAERGHPYVRTRVARQHRSRTRAGGRAGGRRRRAGGGRGVGRLVDAVCFTGSVKTGRLVAAAAAQRLIPAFLELGGKDAAIVTATADLEVASSAILWGSTAEDRPVVHVAGAGVRRGTGRRRFVRRLVARAAKVTLAQPGPADGDLGPFIDDRQADVVAGQLADAVAKGATIRYGGEIETHGGRRYLRPTVVTGVNHGMTLMRRRPSARSSRSWRSPT